MSNFRKRINDIYYRLERNPGVWYQEDVRWLLEELEKSKLSFTNACSTADALAEERDILEHKLKIVEEDRDQFLTGHREDQEEIDELQERIEILNRDLDLKERTCRLAHAEIERQTRRAEDAEEEILSAHCSFYSNGATYIDGCSIADLDTGEVKLTEKACSICRSTYERTNKDG